VFPILALPSEVDVLFIYTTPSHLPAPWPERLWWKAPYDCHAHAVFETVMFELRVSQTPLLIEPQKFRKTQNKLYNEYEWMSEN